MTLTCYNPYIPHHRNLGLKPWATTAEVVSARRTLNLRIHPDKIRSSSQKAPALAAMKLINEVYSHISKHRPTFAADYGPSYPFIGNWIDDPIIDSFERQRRVEENDRILCSSPELRKPWWTEYNTYAQCDAQGLALCGEYWVDLVHTTLDPILAEKTSDRLWALASRYREGRRGRSGELEIKRFFGHCGSVVEVEVPRIGMEEEVMGEIPPWSFYRGSVCAETSFGGTYWNQVVGCALGVLYLVVLWKVIKKVSRTYRLRYRVINWMKNIVVLSVLTNIVIPIGSKVLFGMLSWWFGWGFWEEEWTV